MSLKTRRKILRKKTQTKKRYTSAAFGGGEGLRATVSAAPLDKRLLPGPCQCHPRVGSVRPSAGCLPVSILQKAAQKVLPPSGGASKAQKPSSLRKQLAKHLNVNENDEWTFTQALPLDTAEVTHLQKQYLRPKQPDSWKNDPDLWLDSNNIADVMKQYEEIYPDFEFLGPFPIDFAAPDPAVNSKDKCLIGEICNLDIKKSLDSGKTRIGIIYNLDPHYKDGSHWVANYVDLKNHKCYYFDSYGFETPSQIEKFMQWLTLQDPKMKLAYNARRFQFRDSECGMYSLYFIIRMLMGEEFQHFCHRAPRDGKMLYLRRWLFST